MVFARQELLYDLFGIVEIEAVAAGFTDTDVEPDRRVETGLLGEHEMGELMAEVLTIFLALEVISGEAPICDGVDNAMDELGDARLAFRGTHPAMEIFAGHNVGRGLRPVSRDLHVMLFKNDSPFVVADSGGTHVPGELVVGRGAGLQLGGKETWERHPGALISGQRTARLGC